MFPTLQAEIARKGLTTLELSKMVGMSNSTLSDKVKGKRKLTIQDAKTLKKVLGVNMSLDELFLEV